MRRKRLRKSTQLLIILISGAAGLKQHLRNFTISTPPTELQAYQFLGSDWLPCGHTGKADWPLVNWTVCSAVSEKDHIGASC